MRSILLLPLVARGLETIDVCIWRMFVFMSVAVFFMSCRYTNPIHCLTHSFATSL